MPYHPTYFLPYKKWYLSKYFPIDELYKGYGSCIFYNRANIKKYEIQLKVLVVGENLLCLECFCTHMKKLLLA